VFLFKNNFSFLQKDFLASFFNQNNWISELDALGDELLADEDNSYLDEAASAPAIPEGTPVDTKNKVSPFLLGSQLLYLLLLMGIMWVAWFWLFNILNKNDT